MAVTLMVAIALPLLLPARFSLGPRWIIPVVEAGLLVTLAFADPGRIDRRSAFIRAVSLVLVAVLAVGAAVVTARLVVDLVRGGPETNSPGQLLRVGSLVWVYVIIAFSFLYWELDGGGPEARARGDPHTLIWPFLSTSIHGLPVRRGARSSSTTSTSPSPTPPLSARPMSCRWPVGPSWPWRFKPPRA